MMKQMSRAMIILGMCGALLQGAISQAQDTSLTLTLTTEHDIGYECPVASTQQPDTDIIWVLMDNCGGSKLSLHSYDLKSGVPTDAAPLKLEGIDGKAYNIYTLTPLAFTPARALELFAGSNDTDDVTRFQIDLNSGEVTTDAKANAQFNTFVRQFSQYPDFALSFSPDHTRATISDDDGTMLYVLDLVNEAVLFKIDTPIAYSAFSADSQQLYLSAMDDPNDPENMNSTVSLYSLPDGDFIQSLPMPLSLVYPSPDGRYLAIQTATNEGGKEQIGLVEVATGHMSPLLKIGTDPMRVVTCVNTGKSISDLDFKTSGNMWLRSLHWLPDSSGFITVNSYGNQMTSSGCALDYSRLREYSIGGK